MDRNLGAGPDEGSERVRVQVARNERDLEKQHARGPHRRCSAEMRQHEFPEQRLEQKEQERVQENRESERHGLKM